MGHRKGAVYNGHFESVCYHPLFLFNEPGDCVAATLRPGNVHSADDWDDLLVPEIERQQVAGSARGVPRGGGVREAGDLRRAGATRRGLCHPHALEQEPGAGHRGHAVSSAGTAEPHALGALQEFPLSGEELDHAQTDRRQVEHHRGELFPRALFAFCIALVAYNALAVVKGALRHLHGEPTIHDKVSGYYKRGTAEQWITGGDGPGRPNGRWCGGSSPCGLPERS